MFVARHWDGAGLLLFWLTAAASCWLARWSLRAGIYRGSIEGSQVADLQGLWTPAFANGATLLVLALTAISIAATTAIWITGRKDRDAMTLAVKSGHRSLLK